MTSPNRTPSWRQRSDKPYASEQRLNAVLRAKDARAVYFGVQTISSTTQTPVTNMTLPVVAGVAYEYEIELVTGGNQNAGSVRYQTTGPAVTASNETLYVCNMTGAASQQSELNDSFGGGPNNLGTLSTGSQNHIIVRGWVTFSAAGNLVATVAESTSGDSFTVNVAKMIIRPMV